MSKPPSDPPSKPPSEEPPTPVEDLAEVVTQASLDFGLSKAELKGVIRKMLAVVRSIGCHAHVDLLEVVHDAFVMASRKPISERPPITEPKRFTGWMCTLAELAAKTNRKSKHRRLLGQGTSESELDALLSAPGHAEAVEARELLRKASPVLTPEQRALIQAFHVQGKTIQEVADEQGLPWSTAKSRYVRAMQVLREAVLALIAATILFFTKNVRAQGVRLTMRTSRLLAHAPQAACAMTVTVACGVTLPASSSAMTAHDEARVPVVSASTTPVIAALAMPMPAPAPEPDPSSNLVVEPVKPIDVDVSEDQCSAFGMKSSKIVRSLQESIVPFAFLVAPAVVNVACAGAERHTPPPQQPEERDDSQDPYDAYCEIEESRGGKCKTRADWYAIIGLCPDGTEDCKR